MRDRESGYFLLPVVLLLAVAVSAAFLLVPSLDREDLIEAQRLRQEQARAAAEAALALALHRESSVTDLEVGRAVASATFDREGEDVVVRARARVPSLRDAHVRYSLTARYRLTPAGTYELLGSS
ncbi:MAG: hypothetical protein ACYTDY_02340 [Planctomycetota bacterium]|jgi:hypothetical protein